MVRSRVVGISLGALGLFGVGFLGFRVEGANPGAGSQTVTGDSLDVVPSQTAVDWVTYGDHLVEMHLVSQDALPVSAEQLNAGEGLIDRKVTFAVDKTLWSRTGAPDLPATLTWVEPGWQFQGDGRQEFAFGPVRLDSGHEYLVAVTKFETNGATTPDTWGPLSYASTVMLYDGGRIDAATSDPVSQVTRAVDGQPAEALAALLTATLPDPLAAPYMDLAPAHRSLAVLRFQHASPTD